ncbi:MAG TPA: trimeric intracellular cation channel family protein [Gemmatimonadales bacterium]|nr:trimeric intracellular cation channel family protein [Gemmatimonadales bacterium]
MPFSVPPLIDLGAVLVGGLSGTLLAVRKQFDLVGCVSLAIVAGVGGGVIRDVLLQQGAPAALQDSRYLLTAVVAAAVGFYRSGSVVRVGRVLIAIDALYLAVYTVVGALKALGAGLAPVPAVFLGIVTAVGGGILRDVLAGEAPTLFRTGELYATVSATGSALFVALWESSLVSHAVAGIIAMIVMVVLRLLAVYYGWKAPLPPAGASGTGLA